MNSPSRFRFVSLLALAVLVFAAAAAAPRAKAPARPKLEGVPVPFRVGEQLDYQIGWANFVEAATAHLSVTEERPFYRWQAWHFRAVAHTVDPLRYLYTLDDQFDSYADTEALASHQYELHLQEQGKQESRILRLTADHEPRWSDGPSVIVLPETRDPIAALYYLRAVDWQHHPEVQSAIYDGTKFYEMRADLEASEDHVKVPAGGYDASRIRVQVYTHGQEPPQARFTVWLAHDAARTPVRIEGEVLVGTVHAELLKAVQ